MKPGFHMLRASVAVVAAAALSGCFGETITGTIFQGRGTNASSAQTSGTSGGASGGIGASASGSGTGGSSTAGGISSSGSSTGTGSGTASSTGGSSTGGSSTGFADGGYVFCSRPGTSTWLCTPGTYFCDADDAGICFQCLSDADCADQGRPTYDAKRLRCDLHSGIPGYQNFCQECLANADCTTNPSGPLCDLNPSYPPVSSAPITNSSIEPSIVDLGFETCGILQTDCRVDGGPNCHQAYNEQCEPDSGQCEYLSGCSTDADCTGVLSGNSFPLLPLPYCVMGQCSDCLNGICPNGGCTQDSACVNPLSPPGVAACWPTGECGCLSDSQCSGLWPRCEYLDAGYTTDAGLPLGLCGCDQDDQCGDGGLTCPYYGSSCSVSCTSPQAPACASLTSAGFGGAPPPICNPSTGSCEACTSDQQCKAEPFSGGPICTVGGTCGCMSDGDCPTSRTCQESFWFPYYGWTSTCVPSVSRCTPESCGALFCDWDSGECLSAGFRNSACLTDYDCSQGESGNGRFCDPATGLCGTCNTDADCMGLHCFKADSGQSSCGCLSDADCGGNGAGPLCENHSCGCLTPQDCQAGQSCLTFAGARPFSACGTVCAEDSDCQSGYSCDPGDTCRARCDTGPCPGLEPVCDNAGIVGQNDRTAAGFAAGVTWCYQCLAPGDCGSSGCNSKVHQCGGCQSHLDCPAGDVCQGQQCVVICGAGSCPAGQICDRQNVTGQGADLCHECLGPIDCPNGEGCASYTQTCGGCYGPTAEGGPYDCPPGDICSSYWSGQEGVCLQRCDESSCPADRPLCAVLPALTPDHKYCFGCLKDSDCLSLGANAWCDVSVGLTFSCQVPPL